MESSQLRLYPTVQTKSISSSESEKSLASQAQTKSHHPHKALNSAANAIFSQDIQDSVILRTRKNLGEVARSLSDEQIETIVSEFQFLANTWLDEFEKEIFSGHTLQEVINHT